VADGTYWRPRNGRQIIVQRFGTLAAPLASLTGVASGVFALPKLPEFPAGLIAPNSRVTAQVDVARTGVNGTATLADRLGTAGTSADSSIYQTSMAATDALMAQIDQSARFGATLNARSSTLLLACALALCACQSPPPLACPPPVEAPALTIKPREPNLRQRLHSLWTESQPMATPPSSNSTNALPPTTPPAPP